MRFAAAIIATFFSFSVQALDSSMSSPKPTDVNPIAIAQLDAGSAHTQPKPSELAPIPSHEHERVSASPRPRVLKRTQGISQHPTGADIIDRRPARFPNHHKIAAVHTRMAAPQTSSPSGDYSRPVESLLISRRRCENISCPGFILLGVAY
jgi:hypothetical protein